MTEGEAGAQLHSLQCPCSSCRRLTLLGAEERAQEPGVGVFALLPYLATQRRCSEGLSVQAIWQAVKYGLCKGCMGNQGEPGWNRPSPEGIGQGAEEGLLGGNMHGFPCN